jgi:hypothetical protein
MKLQRFDNFSINEKITYDKSLHYGKILEFYSEDELDKKFREYIDFIKSHAKNGI